MSWCAVPDPSPAVDTSGGAVNQSHPPPPSASVLPDKDLRYEFSLAPVAEYDSDTDNATPARSRQVSSVHANTSANTSANTAAAAAAAAAAAVAGSVGPGARSLTTTAAASVSPSVSMAGGSTASSSRVRGVLQIAGRGIAKGGRGGGISRPPARGALSHTKLCRDRLNGMFERLRSTLPAAPVGVEVKHKAQVLDYAISVLKTMVRRTSELEIELAVSSNRATMDWVTRLVAAAPTFAEVATEVMRVFSKRRQWRLSELWLTDRGDRNDVHLKFGAAVVNDALGTMTPTGESVAAFAEASRAFEFRSSDGVQGRVLMSMRPEWLAGLRDAKDFVRAPLASRFGFKTCLAVPITITGKIEAVMCFYDTKHRPFDSQCVDLAMRLTWALGNATGGKRAGAIENNTDAARSK